MYKGLRLLREYKTVKEIKQDLLSNYNDVIENMKGVFIFGTKTIGQRAYENLIRNGYSIIGFIDNNTSLQGKYINNVKVYSLEEALKISVEATVIICSLTYGGEMEEQLIEIGIKQYIHYPILTLYSENKFPICNQCLDGILEDLIKNKDRYIELFDKMQDIESKDILNNIILYRMTFKLKYIKKAFEISIKNGEEYFDKKIIKDNLNVFVDGGGYLGETTEKFIEFNKGQYRKVYFFEPDLNLLDRARKNLSKYENIELINAGLGKKRELLMFNDTGDMGGNFCDNGNIAIQIECLDEYIDKDIDFIKLDVEGFERDTIVGAKKMIVKNRPHMVISAYHKPSDIWGIVEEVDSIYTDYKLYIRHYTKNILETDLYFIPNK